MKGPGSGEICRRPLKQTAGGWRSIQLIVVVAVIMIVIVVMVMIGKQSSQVTDGGPISRHIGILIFGDGVWQIVSAAV